MEATLQAALAGASSAANAVNPRRIFISPFLGSRAERPYAPGTTAGNPCSAEDDFGVVARGLGDRAAEGALGGRVRGADLAAADQLAEDD
jgi:hypothetical protein